MCSWAQRRVATWACVTVAVFCVKPSTRDCADACRPTAVGDEVPDDDETPACSSSLAGAVATARPARLGAAPHTGRVQPPTGPYPPSLLRPPRSFT